VQTVGSTRLIVRPVAPFSLDLTVWALRRRRRNAIDRWDGDTYRRVIVVGARPTELSIRLTDRDDDTVRSALLELRGVGRWTAEYVLLRGLGRLHVFPGDDVGAQNSLARWLGRPNGLDYAGVTLALERWRPYAGMVYFHLLLDGLSQAGELLE
jgi:hypothetical protein